LKSPLSRTERVHGVLRAASFLTAEAEFAENSAKRLSYKAFPEVIHSGARALFSTVSGLLAAFPAEIPA
jgi:hypothetical protein